MAGDIARQKPSLKLLVIDDLGIHRPMNATCDYLTVSNTFYDDSKHS